MGFFSTFTDINRNSANFKQQEQKNADEQAKRNQYFAKNPPSAQEQKEANEFRRVVIDAVNVMDSASENKAESTEMFFEQANGLVSFITMMSTLTLAAKNFATQNKKLGTLKKETNFHKGLEEKIKSEPTGKIREDLKNHKLIDSFKDKYISINGTKVLDTNNWNKLQDETKTFLKENISKDLIKQSKKVKSAGKGLLLIPIASAFVATSLFRILGTKLQVESSRIARYQARHELKDPANFVEYTDEQKAEASKIKENITIPDEVDNDSSLSDIKSLLRDRKAYERESKKLDEVHLKDIQENDTDKAYGRQKVLNRAIRKMNNDAETYSEDLETSAAVLMGSSFIGGALFGKLADLILAPIERRNKEANEKAAHEMDKTLASASLEGKDAAKEIILERTDVWKETKKQVVSSMTKNKSMTGALLAAFIATPFITQLQKNAARAGRFQAKKDLENDPNSFINISDEELNKINTKGKKPKDSIYSAFTNVPKSIKMILEYNKYKKNELKDEKAMAEALKRVKVSDEQVQNAQSLQMRIFKSFDTIDDHSQKYSEDMEAACEIGQEATSLIGTIGMIALPLALMAKPHRIAKEATGLLKTVFTKSKKFATKYADGISENWTKKMDQKVSDDFYYRRHILPMENEINAFVKEADDKKAIEKFEKIQNKMDRNQRLEDFQKTGYENEIQKLRKDYHSHLFVEEIIAESKKTDGNSKSIKDTPLIKDILKEKDATKLKKNLNNIAATVNLNKADFTKVSDKYAMKVRDNLKGIIENIPTEGIEKYAKATMEYIQKNPAKELARRKSDIKLSTQEVIFTKELKPIAYAVGGAFVAGSLGIMFTIEGYLTKLQKKAGRLGVETAIKELNQENEQAKAENSSRKPAKPKTLKVQPNSKTKVYLDMVKAKRAQAQTA